MLLIKGNYFFEGVIKVTEYYIADMLMMLYALFTYSREFVQLCYKYNVDVALCSSLVLCLLLFVMISVGLSFLNSM